jgi:hypothetical protein
MKQEAVISISLNSWSHFLFYCFSLTFFILIQVYEWWSGGVWECYPATLYVTVKGITPPERLPPVLRSRSALQGELSQPPASLELNQNRNDGDVMSDNGNSVVSMQVL